MPNVTLIGSYRQHLDAIFDARRVFLQAGAEVLRPASDQVAEAGGVFVRLAGDPDSRVQLQQAQLEAIAASDFVYVVAPGGYNGPSAMLEIGYAHALGIPIVASEPPFDQAASCAVELIGSPIHALTQTPGTIVLSPRDHDLADLVAGHPKRAARGSNAQLERDGELFVLRGQDGAPIARVERATGEVTLTPPCELPNAYDRQLAIAVWDACQQRRSGLRMLVAETAVA